jgi:hypothetical protein
MKEEMSWDEALIAGTIIVAVMFVLVATGYLVWQFTH